MARRPTSAQTGAPSRLGEPSLPTPAPKTRAPRATTKARKASPSPARVTEPAASAPETAEALEALRMEVRNLREELGARSRVEDPPVTLSVLQDLAERLTATSDSLADSLRDAPKATDFEPLAEHLYEFARNAPRLLEALQDVPKAAGPIETSVRALHEISETLEFTRERFGESLLRLPRAEDYEPLARPLREFAKVSPALAESLSAVLGAVSPLADSVSALQRIAAELRLSHAAVGEALGRPASPPLPAVPGRLDDQAQETLREVGESLREVGQSIEDALATLPSDPEYGRLAANLRELATVSPSLMEWLEEVPRLSRPLGESVDGLREAARRLQSAQERLLSLSVEK